MRICRRSICSVWYIDIKLAHTGYINNISATLLKHLMNNKSCFVLLHFSGGQSVLQRVTKRTEGGNFINIVPLNTQLHAGVWKLLRQEEPEYIKRPAQLSAIMYRKSAMSNGLDSSGWAPQIRTLECKRARCNNRHLTTTCVTIISIICAVKSRSDCS